MSALKFPSAVCVETHPLHQALHHKSDRIPGLLDDFHSFLMRCSSQVNSLNLKDAVASLPRQRMAVTEDPDQLRSTFPPTMEMPSEFLSSRRTYNTNFRMRLLCTYQTSSETLKTIHQHRKKTLET
ncbi:hypothetical protein E2C01_077418 [Portunus trituberculatus]|uniref:Uncharacterized protein n=1 Tax=Portunus trituberculatus TaxID=210409 RepID=A0A5B7IM80_PORTR|nr:hypothetical protein [Portunus trituberculatus]